MIETNVLPKSNVSGCVSLHGWEQGVTRNRSRLKRLFVLIDLLGLRDCHYRGGILIQRRNTSRQKLRCAEIVRRVPFEELTSGQLKDSIVIPNSPSVDVVPVIAEAWFAAGEGSADLLGSVCGSIVRNYDFEVGKGLAQQRLQRFRQKRLAVEHGNANCHARVTFAHSLILRELDYLLIECRAHCGFLFAL